MNRVLTFATVVSTGFASAAFADPAGFPAGQQTQAQKAATAQAQMLADHNRLAAQQQTAMSRFAADQGELYHYDTVVAQQQQLALQSYLLHLTSQMHDRDEDLRRQTLNNYRPYGQALKLTGTPPKTMYMHTATAPRYEPVRFKSHQAGGIVARIGGGGGSFSFAGGFQPSGQERSFHFGARFDDAAKSAPRYNFGGLSK